MNQRHIKQKVEFRPSLLNTKTWLLTQPKPNALLLVVADPGELADVPLQAAELLLQTLLLAVPLHPAARSVAPAHRLAGGSRFFSFLFSHFYTTVNYTSVKVVSELGEITFSTGKPKLIPGEAPTFQGF